eukprot:CAMPEP_0197847346 /NCGR_PEP_ID=MMETSP1438-20131217/5768_1 /TAXON_ID=1461541 /ORGANISM="Pterosperma sp., Strain CCMP1384" /LENGTH=72 /DNA_ID=CAMNT_0043459237 /DNA_START=112 /DNA_END=327 /DNA_ORIENTATION=+
MAVEVAAKTATDQWMELLAAVQVAIGNVVEDGEERTQAVGAVGGKVCLSVWRDEALSMETAAEEAVMVWRKG